MVIIMGLLGKCIFFTLLLLFILIIIIIIFWEGETHTHIARLHQYWEGPTPTLKGPFFIKPKSGSGPSSLSQILKPSKPKADYKCFSVALSSGLDSDGSGPLVPYL